MQPTTHNEPLARQQTGTARLHAGILLLLQEIDNLRRTVEDQRHLIAAYEAWVEEASRELEGRKEKASPDEWVKKWYGVDLPKQEEE